VGGRDKHARGKATEAPVSKTLLKQQLAQAISADLATRERAYRTAREGATDDEAKPENDKDTRALELSYLARGEALRVEETRAALGEVLAMPIRDLCDGEPAAIGALVTTRDETAGEPAKTSLFWIAPHGGGTRLARDAVRVLTPKSPMGTALVGKRAGDECEVILAGKTRVIVIASIR
jgi:transcription elongation GreA/GreB family factor